LDFKLERNFLTSGKTVPDSGFLSSGIPNVLDQAWWPIIQNSLVFIPGNNYQTV